MCMLTRPPGGSCTDGTFVSTVLGAALTPGGTLVKPNFFNFSNEEEGPGG